MREIRFRAWDADRKVFYAPIFYGGEWYSNGRSFEDGRACSDQIMQFTGLHDKNGKEIYEGDKVRILYTDWPSKPDNDPRTLEQYLIDRSHVRTVLFHGDRWCVGKYKEEWKEWNTSSIYPGEHGFIEIIGNIYEP